MACASDARKLQVPFIKLTSKTTAANTTNNFDSLASYYIGGGLMPILLGYAVYTLSYDCHKCWYSYVLHSVASVVYALGFVLMTPQLFINYKHKSVAFLPWRKFIYRALNTFIDDLFSFIVRMPTMHRMSCFRDDIVFLIYLYQRRIYPEDMSRSMDDDGNETVQVPVEKALKKTQ